MEIVLNLQFKAKREENIILIYSSLQNENMPQDISSQSID